MVDVKIEPSWKELLKDEFEKPYFSELIQFVKNEYKTTKIYPPGKLIFNAFDHCPAEQTKVVILGQDPYHGPGQAHGLCFSVPEGIEQPPSLQNIFKEINNDLGKPIPTSGNLERWAEQGVLLLNATLTVRAHQAGSHQNKGWETFTDAVIKIISEKRKPRFLPLGFLRPTQRCLHRHPTAFGAEIRTPLPLVCQPGRLVRQSPIQSGECLFEIARLKRNRVVTTLFFFTRVISSYKLQVNKLQVQTKQYLRTSNL